MIYDIPQFKGMRFLKTKTLVSLGIYQKVQSQHVRDFSFRFVLQSFSSLLCSRYNWAVLCVLANHPFRALSLVEFR